MTLAKKESRNIILNALRKLRENHMIKPDTDVILVCEILMAFSSGALEAYFGKRLANDLDVVIKNGFDMIYNNIKCYPKDMF